MLKEIVYLITLSRADDIKLTLYNNKRYTFRTRLSKYYRRQYQNETGYGKDNNHPVKLLRVWGPQLSDFPRSNEGKKLF